MAIIVKDENNIRPYDMEVLSKPTTTYINEEAWDQNQQAPFDENVDTDEEAITISDGTNLYIMIYPTVTSSDYASAYITKYKYNSNLELTKEYSAEIFRFWPGNISLFIHNGELHLIGYFVTFKVGYRIDFGFFHYKFNESNYTMEQASDVSSLDFDLYNFSDLTANSVNGKIHLFSCKKTNNVYVSHHYIYNGNSWTDAGNLPDSLSTELDKYNGLITVSFGKHIYFICENTNFYRLDDINTFVKLDDVVPEDIKTKYESLGYNVNKFENYSIFNTSVFGDRINVFMTIRAQTTYGSGEIFKTLYLVFSGGKWHAELESIVLPGFNSFPDVAFVPNGLRFIKMGSFYAGLALAQLQFQRDDGVKYIVGIGIQRIFSIPYTNVGSENNHLFNKIKDIWTKVKVPTYDQYGNCSMVEQAKKVKAVWVGGPDNKAKRIYY